MPPILLNNLKSYLGILQDKQMQLRVWTGQTEDMLDFVETICGVFDDSGFTTLLKEGRATAYFGEDLTALLSRMGVAIDKIDPYEDPAEIVDLPEMDEVRQLAKESLATRLFNTLECNQATLDSDHQ